MANLSKPKNKSPSTTAIRQHVSNEITNNLTAKLAILEKRIDKLIDMFKALLIKNTHFIKEITVNWVENPNRKLGGIIDCGAILTVSGTGWVDSYIKRNGLRWDALTMTSSKERFRFGDGAPMNTKTTVVLPLKITDQEGKNTIIKLKVYVVQASVPLLIGKDAHLALNICTVPSTSSCQLGLEPNRRTYQLSTTSGGHWCIEFQDLLEGDEFQNNCDHNMTTKDNFEDFRTIVCFLLSKSGVLTSSLDPPTHLGPTV